MRQELKREYLVRETGLAMAMHNGHDEFEIAEMLPGKAVPVKMGKLYKSRKHGGMICCLCSEDLENQYSDMACEHTAVAKTWSRQGYPEERVYFITEGNRVGYYKAGKEIFLSKVK